MSTSTVIQIRHLTKCYGALTAVRDLSLDIEAGEVFGLLGPNGAGKTTSINILCGLLKPDSGEVLVHGKTIPDGSSRIRRRVGMCPQSITLWNNLTCLEQMQYVGELYGLNGKAARERSLHLLVEMDLAEKKNTLARKLSGGMQRRLNLALALVHDPDILVLDEPEAGLDPQSRVLVREYIRSLAHQKTVILTTHNMDEAERMADRVAIIDHGELLVVDTPEALRHRVGQGDVLEIELNERIDQALEAVRQIAPVATSANHTLIIRARAVVDDLPSILQALQRAGAVPGEIRLRPNSLEDVFISLTGRRLRE